MKAAVSKEVLFSLIDLMVSSSAHSGGGFRATGEAWLNPQPLPPLPAANAVHPEPWRAAAVARQIISMASLARAAAADETAGLKTARAMLAALSMTSAALVRRAASHCRRPGRVRVSSRMHRPAGCGRAISRRGQWAQRRSDRRDARGVVRSAARSRFAAVRAQWAGRKGIKEQRVVEPARAELLQPTRPNDVDSELVAQRRGDRVL